MQIWGTIWTWGTMAISVRPNRKQQQITQSREPHVFSACFWVILASKYIPSVWLSLYFCLNVIMTYLDLDIFGICLSYGSGRHSQKAQIEPNTRAKSINIQYLQCGWFKSIIFSIVYKSTLFPTALWVLKQLDLCRVASPLSERL